MKHLRAHPDLAICTAMIITALAVRTLTLMGLW